MITVNLIQGSPEWHRHRAAHFNASDAPAMLGVSKYKTRAQLLKEMATGITDDVDQATQRLFDDGHRFEALARHLAEKLIGDDLSPVVGVSGKLSASFDGITFDETVIFEHKTLNDTLRNITDASDLPEQYRVQMEQQLLVSGATQCLFMASRWTDDNELAEPEMHVWYESDAKLRARIVAGWEQFDKDLANYQPVEIAEKPKADVVIELPALFVHARGEITEHNMDVFGAALTNRLAEVRAIALVTDQDFSNAKAAAVKFRETAKAIKLSKEQMLAHTDTIGEAARKMDAWVKDLNETALQLEKDVEREDLAKKRAMVDAGTVAFAVHIDALEAETKPIRLNLTRPDFAAAIKNKRSYDKMQDAVDTALANGKIEADKVASDIRAKLAWFNEYAKGYEALFADLQQIICKPEDDFELLVETRIANHKHAEAEKLEADRERIRQEEAEKLAARQQESTAASPSLQQVADVAQPSSPASVRAVARNSNRSAPTLRLGSINDRLGFNVTADFLSRLGFAPHSEGAAKLYHDDDFPLICRAIAQHISAVLANQMKHAA